MDAGIPHLPAEIHRLIAAYVHREDLPHYRLASKQLCVIGTEELFGTIVFHYSTASVDRLQKLSANDRLRRCVKTIFWDDNLWHIYRVEGMHEWKMYWDFTAGRHLPRHRRSDSQELDKPLYAQLAEDRREWEAYGDKVKDERIARQTMSQFEALGNFQNLRSIHMVNGQLSQAHRGVRKVAHALPRALPVSPVLRRGEGINFFYALPGVEAFRTVQQYCKPSLRKLKLDRVQPQAFTSWEPGELHCLTSLDITIFGFSGDWRFQSTKWTLELLMENLEMFIACLPELESLKLGLENGQAETTAPLASIRHVFAAETTWPKLRKLSLSGFSATPETLVSLLSRHSSTLKDLRLCDISWKAGPNDTAEEKPKVPLRSIQHCAWPGVLQEIAECLSLKRATVSGTLGENGDVLGWRLDKKDDGLAADVESYLVSGGQCPLTAHNAHFAIDNCELPPISVAS